MARHEDRQLYDGVEIAAFRDQDCLEILDAAVELLAERAIDELAALGVAAHLPGDEDEAVGLCRLRVRRARRGRVRCMDLLLSCHCSLLRLVVLVQLIGTPSVRPPSIVRTCPVT